MIPGVLSSTRRRQFIVLFGACFVTLSFIASVCLFLYPNYLRSLVSSHPWSSSSPSHSTGSNPPKTHTEAPPPNDQGSWTFDPKRDERNYGLSEEQCDAAFPGYYRLIEEALEHRKRMGPVKEEDLDIHWRDAEILRAMIYDRQIYIIDAIWTKGNFVGFDVYRALGLLSSMHRAIIAYPGEIPNIEFTMVLGDIADGRDGTRTVWSLTRLNKQKEKWVMPDFGFWSWPLDTVGEYHKVRQEIIGTEGRFEDKYPQAVWRGALGPNVVRPKLVEVARDKPWSDIQEIKWLNKTSIDPATALTIPEHCRYQYVVHTEGNSYSGRGKYLQNCNSVVIMHKLEWLEPHTHLRVSQGPEQNFVEVDNKWTGLDEKMKHLQANPDEAKRIAENGVKVFRDRYLTPAAQACYWRKMIWAWKSVQGFEPTPYEQEIVPDPSGKEKTKKKWRWRGRTFETFVGELLVPDHW